MLSPWIVLAAALALAIAEVTYERYRSRQWDRALAESQERHHADCNAQVIEFPAFAGERPDRRRTAPGRVTPCAPRPGATPSRGR